MPVSVTDNILRRRVILLVLTDFLWGMGWYFVSFTTTIPAYLRAIGASTIILGIMATAMGALPLVLPLFGRTVIDRFPHRKTGIIILHLLFIAPYFVIPLADSLLPPAAHPTLALITIAVLAFSQLVMGLILPVWLDMLAQVIPEKMRGRYFGMTAGGFACGGILGGIGLAVLQRELGSAVFRGAFTLAGTLFVLAMGAFALTPIPETAFVHPPEASILTRVRKSLRASHPRTNFGRFVLSYCAQMLAVTVVVYLADYAASARGLHYPRGIFSTINLWQAVGGTAGALFLGWMVDHIGPRWPWVGLTCAVPLVMFLMPFGGYYPILVLCSLLSGLLITHWSVGGPALLELSPKGDKSGYIAIANMAAFPASVLGPLLIAHLIDSSGYRTAFLFPALAGLAAFLIALTIRGRETPTEDAPLPVDE